MVGTEMSEQSILLSGSTYMAGVPSKEFEVLCTKLAVVTHIFLQHAKESIHYYIYGADGLVVPRVGSGGIGELGRESRGEMIEERCGENSRKRELEVLGRMKGRGMNSALNELTEHALKLL